MGDVSQSQRTYRSPLREAAALRTRDIVVRAATQVFAERGYAGATIVQIAAYADVSRPTVFAVGTKAQLFALAYRHAATNGNLAANDEDIHKILTITDPYRLLEQFATHTAAIMRRVEPLQIVLEQTAGTDPELADLLESSQQRLQAIADDVVAAIAAKGSLRHGIPSDAATDMLWLQIQHANYRHLVQERGWSHRQFERWHATAMITALLEPSVAQQE